MSLQHATLNGDPVDLPGEAPFPARSLTALHRVPFELPRHDPWVSATGDHAHAYVDAARAAWSEHPEYMDFLDIESPVYDLKRAEADLYLHHWSDHLGAERVLDVGCGIGRFGVRFLDRGATVHGVDPDLESLRRFAWHAAGRDGRLDLHWASVQCLPDVEVELAVAAEVLCYVPDHDEALRQIARRVIPGGRVLLSVEAPWGWAASADAPANSLEIALGTTPLVDCAGERWVRTYDPATIEAWVRGAGLELDELRPSHWIPDGPLEDIAPAELSLEQLIDLEARCRAHPAWGPLHRLWLVTARRPT